MSVTRYGHAPDAGRVLGLPVGHLLGHRAHDDGWVAYIHRQHRCDLSLFQLGLRLLEYLLNHEHPIPSTFDLEPESVR